MQRPGYDPHNNPNPPDVLKVDQIEFKMKFTGRPLKRVWLIRTPEGEFVLPHLTGLNVEEATFVRRLSDVLPRSLNAQ